MRDSRLEGMQDFDSVIKDLIQRKVVTLEDGLTFATNQNNLLLELKGVTAQDDFLRAETDASPVARSSRGTAMLDLITP
jgi:Tfp pilus assembly ATPase PilU